MLTVKLNLRLEREVTTLSNFIKPLASEDARFDEAWR